MERIDSLHSVIQVQDMAHARTDSQQCPNGLLPGHSMILLGLVCVDFWTDGAVEEGVTRRTTLFYQQNANSFAHHDLKRQGEQTIKPPTTKSYRPGIILDCYGTPRQKC